MSVTLHKMHSSDECSEVTVDEKDARFALTFGGLDKGSCSEKGFIEKGGSTQTLNVRFLDRPLILTNMRKSTSWLDKLLIIPFNFFVFPKRSPLVPDDAVRTDASLLTDTKLAPLPLPAGGPILAPIPERGMKDPSHLPRDPLKKEPLELKEGREKEPQELKEEFFWRRRWRRRKKESQEQKQEPKHEQKTEPGKEEKKEPQREPHTKNHMEPPILLPKKWRFAETVSLYKLSADGDECGEARLPTQFKRAAVKVARLKQGDCYSLGFHERERTELLNFPVVGELVIVIWTRPKPEVMV